MNLLVIEDNPIEQLKIKKVYTSIGAQEHTLELANNAEMGIKILEEGTFYPDLILLDLNMPGMGGLGFLKHIKNWKEKANIPVIIFSTSRYAPEVKACYDFGASAYFVKPMKFDYYQEFFRRLLKYWSFNELVSIPA